MFRLPLHHYALGFFLLASYSTPALAQILNPDFELPIGLGSGTGGPAPGTWERLGDVRLVGNCVVYGGAGPGIPPDQGMQQCQIGSDSTKGKPTHARDVTYWQNETQKAPYGYNDWNPFKPFTGPYWGWPQFTQRSGAFGEWYNAYPAEDYWHVSGIKQTVAVTKGDVLRIRYCFLTENNIGPSKARKNKAFFCFPEWAPGSRFFHLVSNQSSKLATDTTGCGLPYSMPYSTRTFRFPASETLTILIGVVDVYAGSTKKSVLLVDDIRINTPGITVTPPPGEPDLEVEEGKPGKSFDVVLDAKPAGNVTVNITPDAQLNAPVPASLTFTPANWDTPQTIMVTAFDDMMVEGNHTGLLTFDTSTSADAVYGALPNQIVSVDVIDNDTPGLRVVYPNGFLYTVETGQTDTYTVALNTLPTSSVTVNLTSPDGQVTFNPTTLTFTPAGATKWDVPQTVTVTAIADNILEGKHTGAIRHVASSTDPVYEYTTISDPNLSVDTETNISDPPRNSGGEGDYPGSTGAGPKFTTMGEGVYGLGRSLVAPAKSPRPILLGPTGAGGGKLRVLNNSVTRTSVDADSSTGVGLIGTAMIAILGAGVLMLSAKICGKTK